MVLGRWIGFAVLSRQHWGSMGSRAKSGGDCSEVREEPHTKAQRRKGSGRSETRNGAHLDARLFFSFPANVNSYVRRRGVSFDVPHAHEAHAYFPLGRSPKPLFVFVFLRMGKTLVQELSLIGVFPGAKHQTCLL